MKLFYKLLLTGLLIITPVSAFSQDEYFLPTTTIGGYGELHYNYSKKDNSNSTRTLDFHRFVLFIAHTWNEKWSFKSEIELEHNFVNDGDGELELEQAYVDYYYSDYLGLNAGVLLVSAGHINENHEPPTFFGVERPEYSKNIIPTTWFGNGVALYGTYKQINYRISAMESLDPSGFSAKSGIRGGRLKGYKSAAENLLYNLRLNYSGIAGLRVGTSLTFNDAMTSDTLTIPIKIAEIHGRYERNNLFVNFEYGQIFYNDFEVEKSQGYYLDIGYNIGYYLKTQNQIIPFFRWSDYNTAYTTLTGGSSEKEYHIKKWMLGLSLKPNNNIVFKMDYSKNTRQLDDLETHYINLGMGYMF